MPKRAKAERVYVTCIEVEGKGDFPYDMLRYDNCTPISPDDVRKIEPVDADNDRLERYRQRRTVRLNCWQRTGIGPTIARWNSFNWACRIIDE